MDPQPNRRNKIVTLSLIFGAQLFAYMIRYALSIVAPTLMTLYHLSPQTMRYILSGWNWSDKPGLPIFGPVVDGCGAWVVMRACSWVRAVSTMARPVARAATSL